MRTKREGERGRSGCNEQEASGMNSQRCPCMAGLKWPGSGRWRLGGGLRVQLDRKRETERRQRERERGPGR